MLLEGAQEACDWPECPPGSEANLDPSPTSKSCWILVAIDGFSSWGGCEEWMFGTQSLWYFWNLVWVFLSKTICPESIPPESAYHTFPLQIGRRTSSVAYTLGSFSMATGRRRSLWKPDFHMQIQPGRSKTSAFVSTMGLQKCCSWPAFAVSFVSWIHGKQFYATFSGLVSFTNGSVTAFHTDLSGIAYIFTWPQPPNLRQ